MFSAVKRLKSKRLVSGVISLAKRKNSSGKYSIHPAIGIARIGNAGNFDHPWYVAPRKEGGLPTIPPSNGNEKPQFVKEFKTFASGSSGHVLRQAAQFHVCDASTGKPVKKEDIKSIKWRCWLANKKACWYNFGGLKGDLMLGRDNSYKTWFDRRELTLRNDWKEKNREELIINYGYREVDASNKYSQFDEQTGKIMGLPHLSDPTTLMTTVGNKPNWEPPGKEIFSLGDLQFDENDNSLYVRGAFGNAVGDVSPGKAQPIEGFAGGDYWWDDISDGPVECEVEFTNGDKELLNAWCVVGSPKYVPELSNISTWDDVVFDMGVREQNGFAPEMVDYSDNTNYAWKYILGENGYKVNIENDIKPIFTRMRDYMWVANIAPMVAFADPPFPLDTTDTEAKKKWFGYLRQAFDLKNGIVHDYCAKTNVPPPELLASHQQLFSGEYGKSFPLMPLNSGDGSVFFEHISKFVTVTPTQYYMLYQWVYNHIQQSDSCNKSSHNAYIQEPSKESLSDDFGYDMFGLHTLDRASVGNCVGYPMSPGIEVTWNIRNPSIYDTKLHTDIKGDPQARRNCYRIKHAASISDLNESGLSPMRDECDRTNSVMGVEPGDLTKRMAIPWQADFTDCSVQDINFTDPNDVRANYPKYLAYWWPVQAPWNVYVSNYRAYEQILDSNTYSGTQVMYQRGYLGMFADVIKDGWTNFGFITNDTGDRDYANYTEKERSVLQTFKPSDLEGEDITR